MTFTIQHDQVLGYRPWLVSKSAGVNGAPYGPKWFKSLPVAIRATIRWADSATKPGNFFPGHAKAEGITINVNPALVGRE